MEKPKKLNKERVDRGLTSNRVGRFGAWVPFAAVARAVGRTPTRPSVRTAPELRPLPVHAAPRVVLVRLVASVLGPPAAASRAVWRTPTRPSACTAPERRPLTALRTLRAGRLLGVAYFRFGTALAGDRS